MAALRNLATRPHPVGLRRQSRHHFDHQIPVKTPQTSHQVTNPTDHLNRFAGPLTARRFCKLDRAAARPDIFA